MTSRWKKAIELGWNCKTAEGVSPYKSKFKGEPPCRLHSKLDGYVVTIRLTN
jgi:hypothetical protein